VACAERAGLRGLAREMMLHMLPQSVDGDTLRMTLDAGHAHLLSDDRVEKIRQHLAARVDGPVKLKVTVQAATDARETPSQRQDRAREKQRESAEKERQSAEDEFRNDPHVRELEAAFGGEVVSGSVKPAPAGDAAESGAPGSA